jgi:molybdopterin molybdotransferase
MISLEEAQARLIALVTHPPLETVPLSDAIGRWTTEPVVAKRTQPQCNMSAMDGYAVAYADGTGPWRVIGESAAGARFKGRVGKGEAVRIFTGALLPEGTDSVIIQEDVTRNGDAMTVAPDFLIKSAQHVRKKGSDFHADDILIKAGEMLTPARIALAAMGGHGSLKLHRRLRVALISTGDELVPPGKDVSEDQIPSTNGIMLAAMLHGTPCDIICPEIVPDSLDSLIAVFQSTEADILVTIGGASVGDHDLVRPALLAAGASLDFWKVAMRPGKPLMAGQLGAKLVLGLPGNPVSAFVTATLFLKPLVAAMSGAAEPLPRREPTILDGILPASGPRMDHVRAQRAGGSVAPFGTNDSGALLSLARSDALIIRPPNSPEAKSGDRVEIYIIS